MNKLKTFFGVLIMAVPTIILLILIILFGITASLTGGVLWLVGLKKYMLD